MNRIAQPIYFYDIENRVRKIKWSQDHEIWPTISSYSTMLVHTLIKERRKVKLQYQSLLMKSTLKVHNPRVIILLICINDMQGKELSF